MNLVDYGYDNDLSELPRGLVELGGVRFDVRGLILLRKGGVERLEVPMQAAWEPYPAQTGDIAVDRPVRKLHVLHGVAFAGGGRQCTVGQCVGRWIWRHEDGTEETTQVLYGHDVQHWWFKPRDEAKEEPGPSRVVWTGSNPFAQARGYSLRLSLRTWDNPRSDAVLSRTRQRPNTSDRTLPAEYGTNTVASSSSRRTD